MSDLRVTNLKGRNAGEAPTLPDGVVITGIATVSSVVVSAGTTALPSISPTGDTNTGIFFPAADTIAASTGGAERLRITAAGNVGIGTTTVDNRCHIATSEETTQYQPVLRLETTSTGDFGPALLFKGNRNSISGTASIAIDTSLSGKSTLIYTADATHRWVGNDKTSERMRLDTGGRLLVGTSNGNGNGGILQLTSGITFPASASASSDANTLDDYEEGTWTPSVGGTATYTEREGNYVKIGKLVYIRCSMTINLIGTGSATTLSGLPFTCFTTVAGTGGHINIGIYLNLAVNSIFVAGYVGSNTTSIIFTNSSSSGASMTNSPAIFGNSARVDFTLMYQV